MASQEERMMILQMVAEQKITPAEAAELLKALEQKDEAPTLDDAPSASRSSQQTSSLGAGLSSLLEDVVERVSSAVNSVVGNRHQFTRSFTGTFAPGEIPLEVTLGNGRVEVEAWDEPDYRVDVVVRVRATDEEEAKARAARVYTVTADEHRFILEGSRCGLWDEAVNVTLKVPRDRTYAAKIRTGNGDVLVKDLEITEGKMKTSNGRMVCRGIQAEELTAKSGNGSVEIEGETGDLEVETGNGSVILRPTGERAQVMRITTGNGSIKLFTSRLSPETGIHLDASTGLGSMTISLPDLIFDRNEASPVNRHVVARTKQAGLGKAQVMVTARTGMGSISVE